MARVIGPLLSLDASGTIASTLTFSKWKGRPYVRQRVVPANPKSVLQVSTRAIMAFLAKNWAAMSVSNKATWQSLADAIVASPFNAYVKDSMTNWTQFLAPSQLTPVTRTGSSPAVPVLSATGGVGQVTIGTIQSAANDAWGWLIFRGLTGFTTARDNLIGVVLQNQISNNVNFVDTGLAPGSYFYNARPFTDDGKLDSEIGEETATVT